MTPVVKRDYSPDFAKPFVLDTTMRETRFAKLTAFDDRDSEFLRWGAAFCDGARRRLADDRNLQGSASSFSGGAMVLLRWAYEKPNLPARPPLAVPHPGARHRAPGSAGCSARSLAHRRPAPTTAAKRPGCRLCQSKTSPHP